jgi:hypothetical protein
MVVKAQRGRYESRRSFTRARKKNIDQLYPVNNAVIACEGAGIKSSHTMLDLPAVLYCWVPLKANLEDVLQYNSTTFGRARGARRFL